MNSLLGKLIPEAENDYNAVKACTFCILIMGKHLKCGKPVSQVLPIENILRSFSF